VSDDWMTPAWLLDLIFDGKDYFDACPLNPEGLREVDGLGRWPTDRPVFLNPPYSDPTPWLRKAASHEGGIVVLVKCDPSARWWQAYAPAFRVTMLGVRLKFGYNTGSAPFPSAIWRRGVI
jgi:DNA N-6-adenine-methyltransferase Dam